MRESEDIRIATIDERVLESERQLVSIRGGEELSLPDRKEREYRTPADKGLTDMLRQIEARRSGHDTDDIRTRIYEHLQPQSYATDMLCFIDDEVIFSFDETRDPYKVLGIEDSLYPEIFTRIDSWLLCETLYILL